MSFTIRPINAVLSKDLDTFTKMDPYCKIIIGSKTFKSRTHKNGGKNPYWDQIFQFNLSEINRDLLMKVQLWDQDIIKDDFIGQGYFNLNQLLSMPGKTQNQYIDLSSKGFNCGRIQLSMVYNGPSINQGMGNYGNYNPNVYFPRNSPKNINPSYGWGNMPNNNFNQGQGWGMNQYQPNTNWNNPPYNQYNQGDQGINPNQNKGSLWKQVKPIIGGGLVVQNNMNNLIYQNPNSWNGPNWGSSPRNNQNRNNYGW